MFPKAVILSSGGLDSTTALAIAKSQGFELYTISFDYGQRHKQELIAAEKVSRAFCVKKYFLCKIDLRQFGGSALTDTIAVPKDHLGSQEIPITYVPARNTIFLSLALAWAETLKAYDIFIGVNALDYSGYPDCRPEYIHAFETLANLATKEGVEGKKFRIHTPLIHLSKSEIIRKGLELGVDYSLTFSCYDPVEGSACGHCDSCLLRLKGFTEVGMKDPMGHL
jgi:7-cyano-7-deazaguanine synthase